MFLCTNCQKTFPDLENCPTCNKNLKGIDYSYFINKNIGKYKIKQVLGIGGMGCVYLAENFSLNKKFALKIFSQTWQGSLRRRFIQEAKLLAELHHPNIVEIFDFEYSEWGFNYYVMEYLEGNDLRSELKKYSKGMPKGQIIKILEQITSGLNYAHKRGIIHRDLKPENIILTADEKQILKIIDFGIAKKTISDSNETQLTLRENIIGTPMYLTPEQIENSKITEKTDQYSLALIVFEMMTGKAARAEYSTTMILSGENSNLIKIKNLNKKYYNEKTVEVLKKATNKEADKRFKNVKILCEKLILSISENKNKSKKAQPKWKQKGFRSIEDEVRIEKHKRTIKKLVYTFLISVGICYLVFKYLI